MYDSDENSGFLDDGGNIANRFSDITLLSESKNGYSELYKAKRYGQWYALKRLLPEVAEAVGYRNLLQKEFLIAVEMKHPCVVNTHSMEVVEGLGLCIIEEYIDGEPWDVYFHRAHPDRDETLRIVGELCDALAYIHSRQFVHCDLKPSNVMITHNGHHVKVLDFGLADNDSFDIVKTVAGSARYAAPELKGRGRVDGRCDLYSLGVMLGELPRQWPALKKVSRRCCHQRAEERYASDNEVVKALRRSGGYWRVVAVVLSLLGVAAVSVYLLATRTAVDSPRSEPDGSLEPVSAEQPREGSELNPDLNPEAKRDAQTQDAVTDKPTGGETVIIQTDWTQPPEGKSFYDWADSLSLTPEEIQRYYEFILSHPPDDKGVYDYDSDEVLDSIRRGLL